MAWILFTLVFLAVLPFGAVTPWAISTLELAIFLLFAAALLRAAISGTTFHFPLRRTALLFLALHGLQLVPLPGRLVALLSPMSHTLVRILRPDAAPGAFETLSVTPWSTVSSLIWVCCCLAAFWLSGMVSGGGDRHPAPPLFGIPVSSRPERAALVLSLVLGLAGTLQAVYGLLEYAMGWNRIFLYVRRYPMEGVAGTFINTNHCAAFLNLCLPLLLALTIYLRLTRIRGSRPASGSAPSKPVRRRHRKSLALVPAGAALLVFVALVFTRSGGGMVSAATSLTLFYAVYLSHRGWRKAVNPTLAALTAAVVCLLVIVILVPPDFRVDAITEETRGDVVNRTTIIGQSLIIARDFPLFGSGAGTYATMMLHYYQRMVVHAHNEYLELLCDLGPLGLFCALLLIIAVLQLTIPVLLRKHVDRFCPDRFPRPLILPLGLSASLGGLAVQSMVEFPLRIPAIALCCACLLGVLIQLVTQIRSTAETSGIAGKMEDPAGEL